MATGQVLFQRFYYSKSFVKHDAEVSNTFSRFGHSLWSVDWFENHRQDALGCMSKPAPHIDKVIQLIFVVALY